MIRPLSISFIVTLLLAGSTAALAASPFGQWRFDPAASTAPAGDTAPAPTTGTPPPGHAGGHHGKGPPGGPGDGIGGMGGGHGGHGGHGPRGDDDDKAGHARPADLADADERGLARTRATTLTIAEVARRIRFDDGEHAIELGRDGMNVGGAGIGGTAALSSSEPDLVVETLTDRGTTATERYHVSDDGRRLEQHVVLKRDEDDAPRTFVRVFDRVGTSSGD
jgi:hypothetical protein